MYRVGIVVGLPDHYTTNRELSIPCNNGTPTRESPLPTKCKDELRKSVKKLPWKRKHRKVTLVARQLYTVVIYEPILKGDLFRWVLYRGPRVIYRARGAESLENAMLNAARKLRRVTGVGNTSFSEVVES